MLDELKAHLEEMLRGFRSGVAVYKDHIVEALAKLERAAAQLVTPAAPAAQYPNKPASDQPAAAETGETATGEAQNGAAPEELAATVTTTAAPAVQAEQPAAAEPQTATVTTDPQPAAAA